jgi:hypothetical protein
MRQAGDADARAASRDRATRRSNSLGQSIRRIIASALRTRRGGSSRRRLVMGRRAGGEKARTGMRGTRARATNVCRVPLVEKAMKIVRGKADEEAVEAAKQERERNRATTAKHRATQRTDTRPVSPRVAKAMAFVRAMTPDELDGVRRDDDRHRQTREHTRATIADTAAQPQVGLASPVARHTEVAPTSTLHGKHCGGRSGGAASNNPWTSPDLRRRPLPSRHRCAPNR